MRCPERVHIYVRKSGVSECYIQCSAEIFRRDRPEISEQIEFAGKSVNPFFVLFPFHQTCSETCRHLDIVRLDAFLSPLKYNNFFLAFVSGVLMYMDGILFKIHIIPLESNEDALQLMNVHQAKGLTGQIVIIADRTNEDVCKYSGFKSDGKYYPATDVIFLWQTNEFQLSNPDVPHPVSARYGYGDFMPGNVYGGNYLPLIPFTTKN